MNEYYSFTHFYSFCITIKIESLNTNLQTDEKNKITKLT